MSINILIDDYIFFKQHGIEQNALIIKMYFLVLCTIIQLKILVIEYWGGGEDVN